MLVGKIKKDFLSGLERLSRKNDCNIEQIQIKLVFGESPENPIAYSICKDWKFLEVSTYKDILNKKFDLIGEENLVTPYLVQAMATNMQEFECEPHEFSAYLHEFKGTIMVSMFHGVNCKKTTPVEGLF
jgi:hypothetical protein